MKRITFCIFAIALMFTFSFQPAIAKEKQLKAVSFLPTNHPFVTTVKVWADRVNDACKGELKVNLVGGPEVIPGLEQIEALAFIAHSPFESYFQNPENSSISRTTRFT